MGIRWSKGSSRSHTVSDRRILEQFYVPCEGCVFHEGKTGFGFICGPQISPNWFQMSAWSYGDVWKPGHPHESPERRERPASAFSCASRICCSNKLWDKRGLEVSDTPDCLQQALNKNVTWSAEPPPSWLQEVHSLRSRLLRNGVALDPFELLHTHP